MTTKKLAKKSKVSFSAYKKHVDATFHQLAESINNVDKRNSHNYERIDKVNQRVDKVNQRVDSLYNRRPKFAVRVMCYGLFSILKDSKEESAYFGAIGEIDERGSTELRFTIDVSFEKFVIETPTQDMLIAEVKVGGKNLAYGLGVKKIELTTHVSPSMYIYVRLIHEPKDVL